MLPSPLLGTAPEMVSGARSPAAARLGGPHGRPEALGPGAERMDPAGRRGAARSLRPTARSSRAAVPQAVRSWQLGAGWPGSVTSSLGVPGTFTGSCGVLGCFPPPAGEGGRARLSAFRDARSGRGRGGRGGRGGGARRRGSCSRSPRSCLQTASGEGTASILSPSPALAPSLFSCLTNPRIIQLRKRWKEVREGGGAGVEIFGSSVPV